jgi:hypothetical protein
VERAPNQPWDTVSLDFMTQLPRTTRGFDAITIFIEAQTRYLRIVPIKKSVSGMQFATIFTILFFGIWEYQNRLFPPKTPSLQLIYGRTLLRLSVLKET